MPRERLGRYLRNLRKLFEKFEYTADLYGHFGQGCVHCRIDFDLSSETGIEKFRAFMREAADLVVSHGGSLSGEHGDGQARGELLDRMFSRDMLQAFAEFKSIWDPGWRMNPGKLIDARRSPRICASDRASARLIRRRSSRSAVMAEASGVPRSGASAWASAARKMRGRCAPATCVPSYEHEVALSGATVAATALGAALAGGLLLARATRTDR